MATTAQDVFDIAISLMDEVDESTGATDTSDTEEYKNRTLLILTALRGELYPLSDTHSQETSGVRGVCSVISDFITDIDIDDVICQTIMPYGLAAHLLLTENPDTASFFEQRYEELKRKLSNIPKEFEAIEDVYGGIEYGEFSRW